MNIYALTSSKFKFNEISKYFSDMGISIKQALKKEDINDNDFIVIYEQTSLYDDNMIIINDKNIPQSVIHKSILYFTVISNQKDVFSKTFISEVNGFIFPNKKTNRTDVYSWDEIFYPEKSQLSYQQMKDKGVKTSARDFSFSQLFEDLEVLNWIRVKFERKINLSFNPIEKDEVVNFDPVIYQLLNQNEIYKLAYQNELFRPLLNKALNDGLFTRRASNRQQKNYWLPGVNAGIPLTPKKDNIHELTFMFHDLMHFVFPDVMLDNYSSIDKKIYIISRMMSEAFTLTLADMLFIHILKQSGIDYNFEKRCIYPLFQNICFDINIENLPKIKEILKAIYHFALKGEESQLINLVKNKECFLKFKEKYQPFFREDYIWTNENCTHLAKNKKCFKQWLIMVKTNQLNDIVTTSDIKEKYDIKDEDNIFEIVFEHFFSILELTVKNNEVYDEVASLKNSFLRYISGQLMIFQKYSSNHNRIFLDNIFLSIEKIKSATTIEIIKNHIDEILKLYNMYLEYLLKMDLITEYKSEQYKNIFPLFDPFYVFYSRENQQTFHDVYLSIFGEKHE